MTNQVDDYGQPPFIPPGAEPSPEDIAAATSRNEALGKEQDRHDTVVAAIVGGTQPVTKIPTRLIMIPRTATANRAPVD